MSPRNDQYTGHCITYVVLQLAILSNCNVRYICVFIDWLPITVLIFLNIIFYYYHHHHHHHHLDANPLYRLKYNMQGDYSKTLNKYEDTEIYIYILLLLHKRRDIETGQKR